MDAFQFLFVVAIGVFGAFIVLIVAANSRRQVLEKSPRRLLCTLDPVQGKTVIQVVREIERMGGREIEFSKIRAQLEELEGQGFARSIAKIPQHSRPYDVPAVEYTLTEQGARQWRAYKQSKEFPFVLWAPAS